MDFFKKVLKRVRKFLCEKLDYHVAADFGKWTGTSFESKCKFCGKAVEWSPSGWMTTWYAKLPAPKSVKKRKSK